MLIDETLMCADVFTLCEGTLPVNNLLENHLQKGSILCMSLGESFQSAVRDGGAFPFSLVDVGAVSAGVVSVVLHVLLWVLVARPSRVDVTNLLIKAVGVDGVPLTFTNHEKQSAALLQASNIHLNVIL